MSLASCHIGDGTPGLAVHAGDVASTGSAEDAPGYYSRSQSQRWAATGFENMRRYASGLARCVKNRRLPHIAAFFEGRTIDRATEFTPWRVPSGWGPGLFTAL